jgi:hypothetical protein
VYQGDTDGSFKIEAKFKHNDKYVFVDTKKVQGNARSLGIPSQVTA